MGAHSNQFGKSETWTIKRYQERIDFTCGLVSSEGVQHSQPYIIQPREQILLLLC